MCVYPQPIRDFKDGTAYVVRADNRVAWAWEFLRRNPMYQHDCDMLRSAQIDKDLSRLNGIVTGLLGDKWPVWCVAKHYMEETSFTGNYKNEPITSGWAPWRLSDYGAGLVYPHDIDSTFKERAIVIAFDPDGTWNSQVHRAKALFDDQQKKRIEAGILEKPKRPPYMPKHPVKSLRILDGVASGASQLEIMQAIEMDPGEETAFQDMLRVASNLRDKDYSGLDAL